MSVWTIVLVSLGVYLIGAVGTARVVFTRGYKRRYPYWEGRAREVAHDVANDRYLSSYDAPLRGKSGHQLTIADDEVQEPAFWCGVLWLGYLPYALLIRPIGTVLVPLAVSWFTAPARKAVKS